MNKQFLIITLLCVIPACLFAQESNEQLEKNAQGMLRTAQSTLAPVYAPLAEWIVSRYDLETKNGVGIDLGSGPGTLIVELAKRTSIHWINADINPYCFPLFFELIQEHELQGRVSAQWADAQNLPFKDNYADVIVSRGSFHMWEDKESAFAEISRVLKPGGIAHIGRGFSPTLPVETARTVREKQNRGGGGLKYSVEDTHKRLQEITSNIGLEEVEFILPQPASSEDIKYGIWVVIRKPERSE